VSGPPRTARSNPSLTRSTALGVSDTSTRTAGYARTNGGAGGTRAVESLRLVMGELQVADVRAQVAPSLFNDFENFTAFRPGPQQEKSVNAMLDQLVAWSGALATLRVKR